MWASTAWQHMATKNQRVKHHQRHCCDSNSVAAIQLLLVAPVAALCPVDDGTL